MKPCKTCNHKRFHITITTQGGNKSGIPFCPYCLFPEVSSKIRGNVSWNIENISLINSVDPNEKLNNVGEIFGYISSGYTDYIAARKLLIDKQNLAGTIFASQAIEKLMKALITRHSKNPLINYLSISPFMTKHKPYELYRLFTSKFNSFKHYQGPFLNPNFLKLLEKVYPLRYENNFFDWGNPSFDKRNSGFGLIINNKEILFELDRCMQNLMFTLNFKFIGTHDFKNPYIRDLENNENFLTGDNIAILIYKNGDRLSPQPWINEKTNFLKESFILELVVDSKNQLQKYFYTTNSYPTSTGFDMVPNLSISIAGKVDTISPSFIPTGSVEKYLNIYFKL